MLLFLIATTSERSSLFLKYLNHSTEVASEAESVVWIFMLLTHAAYREVVLSVRAVSQVDPPR